MIVLSLKEIIEKSGGGSLDKIFGAFFGILRGGFIVVALSLLGTMTALTEEEAWVNAKTRAYLEFSVIQTIPYLPESVVDKIKIDFEETLINVCRFGIVGNEPVNQEIYDALLLMQHRVRMLLALLRLMERKLMW